MSDKKQQETERPERLHEAGLWVKRWWHKLCLLIKEHWLRIFILFPSGVLVIIASFVICLLYLSPEQRATNSHIWLQLYLGALAVTGGLVLYKPQIITSNPKKYFITRVLTTGITGGAFALLLPIAVKSTTTGVGGLRHSILLATGGLLAILTLGETRRKNDIDKDKNDQEKEKNDKDHRRQVRAERRERYTTAIEQLGDDKAPIRTGGVYTLVGLVDEWLEEESLSEEERLKEGQVIINNLCAYIRSPFTLASQYDFLSQNRQKSKNKFKKFIRKHIQRNFYISKAKLQAEADIRLSIIKEIHDRLQGPEENTPGTWSDFEYDFSGSTFFYPVNLTKSYYKKTVNFGGSTYHNEADFSESTYHREVDFSESTYHRGVDFHGSTYHNEADFSESTYHREVYFGESTYHRKVYFGESTYHGGVDFHGSTYHRGVYFGESTYHRKVYFGDSTYHRGVYFGGSTYQWADFHDSTYHRGVYFGGSTYHNEADFHDSTYHRWVYFGGSTYHNEADFHGSTYQRAYFSDSTYHRWANFHGSTYTGWADFSNSIYENWTDFNESIFYQETYFGKDGYSSFSRFTNYAPQFYDKTNIRNTLFGSHNNDFTVDTNEGYPIVLNSEGLPIGCKFLTSEQKEYLEGKLQEIEKINNKLLEAKDPKEKVEISKKLRSFTEKLHEWRKEATAVKVKDVAAENTER